jgi:membrane-associated phospholipid phosphatase
VTPFVLVSARGTATPPFALDSADYRADFTDVKAKGADGVSAPTTRTNNQTITGGFWGYDGAAKLGTPPRLFNQIVMAIAADRGISRQPAELSRLLALANVAMADAAISAWETKYFYNVWRPGNAIRETAAADGGNPSWVPLGAYASNSTNPNFTPPFPAYPSGHATFGGAVFEVLRGVFGDGSFTMASDEYNGVTTDSTGHVRPVVTRTYASFADAEAENARSRIYLGVHWQNDGVSGIAMGNQVGDEVLNNLFLPR